MNAHPSACAEPVADETLTRAGDQAVYRFTHDGWMSRLGINLRFCNRPQAQIQGRP
ncbi:hypothetical protein [Microvirga sp. TS319]|uniref:hypothetical protein n=1 Tax=Microvirga sp. TS319 TaxID=3241165 RepID=UPI003519EBA1